MKTCSIKSSGLVHDPVEDTFRYKMIRRKVEKIIDAEIGQGGYLGYCHKYWAVKKKILKERYNIDWKSPEELNKDVIFD